MGTNNRANLADRINGCGKRTGVLLAIVVILLCPPKDSLAFQYSPPGNGEYNRLAGARGEAKISSRESLVHIRENSAAAHPQPVLSSPEPNRVRFSGVSYQAPPVPRGTQIDQSHPPVNSHRTPPSHWPGQRLASTWASGPRLASTAPSPTWLTQDNPFRDVPGTGPQNNPFRDVPGTGPQKNPFRDVPGTAPKQNPFRDVVPPKPNTDNTDSTSDQPDNDQKIDDDKSTRPSDEPAEKDAPLISIRENPTEPDRQQPDDAALDREDLQLENARKRRRTPSAVYRPPAPMPSADVVPPTAIPSSGQIPWNGLQAGISPGNGLPHAFSGSAFPAHPSIQGDPNSDILYPQIPTLPPQPVVGVNQFGQPVYHPQYVHSQQRSPAPVASYAESPVSTYCPPEVASNVYEGVVSGGKEIVSDHDQWLASNVGGCDVCSSQQCVCECVPCNPTLFYASIFGGWSSLDDPQLTLGAGSIDLDVNDGVAVGFALGQILGRNLRSEIELSFRTGDGDSLSFVDASQNTRTFGIDGDVESLSGLVNLYWEFDYLGQTNLRPYLGGGAGVTQVTADVGLNGVDAFSRDEDSAFVYQWIAGINYKTRFDSDVFVEYRYLAASSLEFDSAVPGVPAGTIAGTDFDYQTNNILFGFRMKF